MALPSTYVEGFHDLESVKKMKYGKLGNTGLVVSKLALGAGAFGNHYGDYELQVAINTIQDSLKRGINYIDTAPFYGEGRSETTLGHALKGVPRSSYYIATKVCRYTLKNAAEAFDFSGERVLKSVDESLKRLGLDYVDIIQVHDVEFAPSIDIIVNEALPALEKIVASGKAKYIGVTGYPLTPLKDVIAASKTKIDLVLSYSRLTLLDDTLNHFLPFFQSKGLGVIHAAPPALGLLTNRGAWDWHPANVLLGGICKKAQNYCKEKGVELGRLAVYWTSIQPGVDIHLIGIQNKTHLDFNLDVINNGLSDLEKQVLNDIQEKFFKPTDRRHWENIELANYWEEMKKVGKGKPE